MTDLAARTMNIEIRRVTPDQTLPLRQKILRPGQPLQELVYPGDLDAESFHVGAHARGTGPDDAETLVGVASVYRQPMEHAGEKGLAALAGTGAWRLRGMAVDDGLRGEGVGSRLLNACIEHVAASGGRVLWCNARTPAERFYLRHGFVRHGDVFELPKIGPHVVMSVTISRGSVR